jgi:hypothetical protein
MKKVIKYQSELFQEEVTFIVDKSLKSSKNSPFVIKKREKANDLMRNVKMPLPK